MRTQTLAWIIISGFVIMLIVILAKSPAKPSTEKWVPDNFDAYVMAKQFVEDRLKAPSTAEFASIHKSTITQTSPMVWTVKSYVDSQNGFGAMIRTKYTISMMVDHKSKKWQVIDIITEP